MSQATINPYGQHFRCMARLFKNALQNEIFMYLMDEYMGRLRKGQTTKLQYSIREISEHTGISRNSIQPNLSRLSDLGVISLEGDVCTVNVPYVVAVVSLFNQKKSLEDKRAIGVAFRDNDNPLLVKYGLTINEHAQSELLDLNGAPETGDNMHKFEPPCTNLTSMHKFDTSDAQICASGGSDLTSMHKFKPLLDVKNVIIEPLRKNFESADAQICALKPFLQSEDAQICASKLANLVWDAQICASEDKMAQICALALNLFVEIAIFSGSNLCIEWLKSVHGVAQICASDMSNLSHRNKYNKDKEKNEAAFGLETGNEDEGLGEGLRPDGLDEGEALWEGEGEGWDDDEETPSVEEENPGPEESEEEELEAYRRGGGFMKAGKLEIIELKGYCDEDEESARRREERRKLQSKLPKMKYKGSFYKFLEEELDEILADIHNCLDRPDKIFINRLWSVLEDYVESIYSGTEDGIIEEGEGNLPAKKKDIHRHPIPTQVMKEALKTAVRETEEIIETRTLDEGEELQDVTTEHFDPGNVRLIVDWETVEMDREMFYVPDRYGFRDIHSEKEPPERKGTSATEEEREDDYTYMQAIMQIGETDEGLSSLTPMESVIYSFLEEFFQLDKDKRIEDFKPIPGSTKPKSFLKRDDFVRMKDLFTRERVSKEDFISIMTSQKRGDYGEVLMSRRVFLAPEIRRWNKRHRFESVVDDYVSSHLS